MMNASILLHGAAALAYVRLKNLRPPMYAGQVVAPALAGTDGGLQPAVPLPNTRSHQQSPTASVHQPPAPSKTTNYLNPTTEHRTLARVPTRDCRAFVAYQPGRRHDDRNTACRSRDPSSFTAMMNASALQHGAAAPAYVHLKNHRPPMYAGQGPVLRVKMRRPVGNRQTRRL